VGKVIVSITHDGDMVEVRIADEGKGIPDEIKHQLFIKGHAFGATGHTGEGLYVSKMTMERYGGSIQVEDNVPHGTVFVLRFRKGVKHEA
jgi:signal transduction histidine kinase